MAALIIALIVIVAAVGIRRLYVLPQVASPLQKADAVVVLGGTPYERFRYGIELAEQGLAGDVVLSNSVGADDPVMRQLCDQSPPAIRVECFVPVPWTTRGEARQIRRLADLRHWRGIIVVTTTAHIERARYIVSRCYSGRIQMVAYPEKRSVRESVTGWIYQSGGWIRALTQSGC